MPSLPLPARCWPIAWACAAILAGCGQLVQRPAGADVAARVVALLPADAMLLGEQHDAAQHQTIERETVEALARRDQLAALAIEMSDAGNSAGHLAPDAGEAEVKTALSWDDNAWPWSAYGPVVMAAVRAGVPVVGANLPRDHMKDAMADVSLDAQLDPEALSAQRDAVRSGHCNLLPETQIGPMTRIQIARDRAMAQTVIKARVPGKTVLLVSGAAHAAKTLGVPRHLPSDMPIRSVQLRAGPAGLGAADFDAEWTTPALPEKDYCAGLRRSS